MNPVNAWDESRKLQLMQLGATHSLSLVRAPPSTTRKFLSFLRDILRLGKLPGPTSTTGNGTVPRSAKAIFLALLSGGLAILHNSVKVFVNDVKELMNAFKELVYLLLLSLGVWSCLAISATAAIVWAVYNNRDQDPGTINVEGRLVLVVAKDIFLNHSTSKSLIKICEEDGVEAILPLCVESLQVDMRAAAAASLLMIKDHIRLGNIRLQLSSEEGLWIPLLDGDSGALSYHQRMVNSAYVYSNLMKETSVLILTNSKSLKSNAVARNQRCVRPADLWKLRREV
ncbi:hypothetical protein ACP70R_020076 [Stipagrostis hirtigluma subsp. patula]